MSKKPAKPAAGLKLSEVKPPEFWEDRVKIFDQLYAAQQAEYAAKKQPIEVTLPDGKKMDAESWVTTPLEIAKRISNSLPDKVIVAKVNDNLWDLGRPLEESCSLELLDWDEPEARKVFWHSSAHVLGYALERVYGCKLSYGPPLEEGGFFYEGDTDRPVSEGDYAAVKDAMAELVKAKAPYQRLAVKKDDALKMFGYNKFKQITLGQKVPEGGVCTVYKCGNLIDPCRGPHVPDTGRIKAFAVTKNSSAYFQGDATKETLQRVYAISFPKESQLKEWQTIVAEAAKRDHRVIARQQELFHFNEISPGSAFWTPYGARIYNALIEFQRKQYRRRGFEEVVSPNMYNAELWKISGHWDLYKDAMFTTVCEHEQFGLKPMNCPGHCMMFAHRPRSYKDLPVRWADFGVLHRNELSGALTGLTRVRRFQQDDAHIFCRLDQVTTEIEGALAFLDEVYTVLGFNFYLKLSTRPESALGDIATWNEAERRLTDALNAYCDIPAPVPDPYKEGETFVYDGTIPSLKRLKAAAAKAQKSDSSTWKGPKHTPWELNAGDGAFYGPKIDIVVEDALKRRHQCATIQLDFQLPQRFGLKYTLPGAREDDPKPEGKEEAPPAVAVKDAPSEPEDAKVQQQHQDPVASHLEGGKHAADKLSAVEASAKERKLHVHIDHALLPNEDRPVMIHRAIFGSLERCIAILCEHFGGKWPFWLSPRQVIVIPVGQNFEAYAKEVCDAFYSEGYHAEVDASSASLDKKIRNAQIAQWNFIFVVGAEEAESKSVNVRTRNNERHGTKTVEEAQDWLARLRRTYSNDF